MTTTKRLKSKLKNYVCEKCNVIVFKELKSLEFGDIISSDCIKSMQGHVSGDKLECKLCGSKLYLNNPSRWSYDEI